MRKIFLLLVITSFSMLSSAQLTGTKTVGTGMDYATVVAAVTALNSSGVGAGGVIFNISPGTYSGQVTINAHASHSDANPIVFQSSTGDSNDVIITFAATSSTLNWTLRLNGAKYVTFKQVTLQNTGATYGRVIEFFNDADYNTVTNCVIKTPPTSTSSTSSCIFSAGTTSNIASDYCTVSNNLFIGGYYAIQRTSTSSGIRIAHFNVTNNIMTELYFGGITISHCDTINIVSNSITSRETTASTFNGVLFASTVNGGTILKNKIFIQGSTGTHTGLNIVKAAGYDLIIANNFISTANNPVGTVRGIYLNGAPNTHVYYNSVNITAGLEAQSSAIYISTATGTNTNIKNNIFSNTGGGYAYFNGNNSSPNAVVTSDYNDLYSTGTYFSRWTTVDQADLAAHKLASGKDANSISVDPAFVSLTDLHVSKLDFYQAATPISGITDDIDGELRHATLPCIGADEFSPPQNDAGVSAIDSPTLPSVLPGSHAVKVSLTNSGLATLTSATIKYNVDGGTTYSYAWTGSLAQGATLANIDLGNFTFVTGISIIKAWTESPNGLVDGNHLNDTTILTIYICNPMAGTYTIGVSGDFTDFASVVSQLMNCGVNAPVVFNIASGTYTGQFTIAGDVPGASSTNTVTFQSASGDSSDVIIQYAAAGTADDWVVKLRGTSFIIIKKLSLKATGTSNGQVCVIENGSHHITLSNCYTETNSTSTSTNFNGIYTTNSTSNPASHHLTFSNNYFYGGSDAIVINGQVPADRHTHVVVSNNKMENFNRSAFRNQYGDSMFVHSNVMIGRAATTSAQFAIWSNSSIGYSEIFNNNIQILKTGASNTTYGIYIAIKSATSPDYMTIANNFVSQVSGTYLFYGIYTTSSNYVNIYNNSVNITAGSTSSAACYIASSQTFQNIKNNIFVNSGGGYSYYVAAGTSVLSSDYNDIYATATNIAYWGAAQTSLAALQATSGMDQNSISIDPGFVSTHDLHVSAIGLNGAGTAVAEVTLDIDGEPRAATPDIGADEFVPVGTDASISWVAPMAPQAAGLKTIQVEIANTATVTINTLFLTYTDGVTPVTQVFPVSIAAGTNQTLTFTTPYNFTGPTQLRAYITSVNFTPDLVQSNDTTAWIPLIPMMSGVYTIDGTLPTLGTNFNSFTDAATALDIAGVNGSVTFNVAAGTYTEQIRLGEIFGASATNTITFQSLAALPTAVTLQYAATGTGDNYVVQLNGADYFTFKNMTIKSIATAAFSRTVDIQNSSNNNRFEGNILESPLATASSINTAVVHNNTASTDTGNVLINNSILNGSYGIYWYGTSSASETGSRIENNTITNAYSYGMYVNYQDGVIIEDNTVNRSGGTSTIYGIYTTNLGNDSRISSNHVDLQGTSTVYGIYSSSSGEGLQVTGNNVMVNTTSTCYLLYLSSCTGTALNPILVANNVVVQTGGTTNTAYALYISSVNYANLYHNSVSVNGGSATLGRALYVTSGSNQNIKNNVLANFNGGYAYYINTAAAVVSSDFNDLYTTGASVGYWSSAKTDLAALQAASGKDINSISVDPSFNSVTNLIPLPGSPLLLAGTPLTEVTTDINAVTRSLTAPTIGAYELTADFVPPVITYVALPNTTSFAARTLTATITDHSGVPTSGTGLPVLYWRIGSGTYSAVQAVPLGSNMYEFTFGAGVVLTDVVSYYIVAQDNAIGKNVGASSDAGVTAYTSDPPTASPAPSNPSTYTIIGFWSGTYTVGTGGDFNTLTAAINKFNNSELNGPVTLLLLDASYTTPAETFPLVIEQNPGTSATNTLTIKPSATVTSSIFGASASSQIFRIQNNNTIIDGSNSGTSSRDLTIQNTSTTSPQVIRFASVGTTPVVNVTLKNTNIINGANTSTALIAYGVDGAAGYFNDIRIVNNGIKKAYMAIYALAVVAPGNGSGLLISQNDINDGTDAIRYVGIYMQGVDGAVVSNNNIGNFDVVTGEIDRGIWLASGTRNTDILNNTISGLGYSSTSSYAPVGINITPGIDSSNIKVSGNIISSLTTSGTGTTSGITLSGASSLVVIEKNTISGITNTNTGGYGCNGIQLSSTSTVANTSVINNVIYDVAGYGYAGSAVGDNGYGIIVTAGAGYNIFYNSVNMNTDQTVVGGLASALNVTSGVSAPNALDVRNNVFANTQTLATNRYAIYSGANASVFMNIDFNDYFSSGTDIGYLGSARAGIFEWRTATGQDMNSVSIDPAFASSTNLVPSSYLLDGGATPIAGITTDFNGVVRNALLPDMGAFEFTALPTIDMGATALVTPTTIGCLSGSELVSVEVKNHGNTSIDFSTTPLTVTTNVSGATTALLTAVVSTGTLAAKATMVVTMSTSLNMSAMGTYTFRAYTTISGDALALNDTTNSVDLVKGIIVPGVASAASIHFCQSGTPELTLTGSMYGDIQWQYSSTGSAGSWINTGSGLSTFTGTPIIAPTYFRAFLSCDAAIDSSNVVMIDVLLPQVLSTTPSSVCDSGVMTLQATTGGANVLNWYADAVGGSPLGSGPSFVTPLLNTTTTYFVSSSQTLVFPSVETLGTAATTTSVSGITPYSIYYEGAREQYLILGSELSALGLTAGNISSLAFDVTTVASGTFSMDNFTIKMAHTSATDITSDYATPSGSVTTVYGPLSLPIPSLSWNTYAFTTPFAWDGVSNVFIEICHDNDPTATCASCYNSDDHAVAYTSTSFSSVYSRYADNTAMCGTTNGSSTSSTNRPNMRFNGIASFECSSDPRTAVVATVNISPTVTLGNIADICIDASALTLITGLPAGGVYSGTGVSGGSFDPFIAGVGTHTITYLYTDGNNCFASATNTITVNALPTVTLGSFADVCVDAGAIVLSGGLPLGGVYSGTGVTAGVFSPSTAGAGLHTITYTYTDGNNCINFATSTIQVHALPVVSLGSFADVCVDGGAIVLSGGSPLGGVYSGTGVTAGVFTPSIAGAGLHTITYTYTDGNNCINFATSTIQVHALPVVSLASFSDVCIDAADFTLSSGSPTGGTYSGTGVTLGSFSPSTAGTGTHVITYTYTDGNSCTNFATSSITVNPLPVVTLGALSAVCVDAPAFVLSGGSPSGGIYSGAGVASGYFDATTAGVGTHTITYTYTDGNSCVSFATTTIMVNALPVVTLAAQSDVCVDAATFSLSGGSPLGGTYSGTGVSLGMFSPSTAGTGTHIITYTYTDGNSCTAFATGTLTVNALPIITVPTFADVCIDAPSFTLSGASPSGGTYSGSGVSANTFSPTIAGVGTHVITYTYTDGNSCTNSNSATLTVNPLPVVTFAALVDKCVDAGTFALSGGSPAGGIYTGTGVSSGNFDPATAGVGAHVITYTYTDGNSCVNSATQTQTVNILPIADAGLGTAIPFGTFTTLNGSASAGSGTYTYAWTPAAMVVNATAQSTNTVSLNATQVYNLVVTDVATGCVSAPSSVTILVFGGPLTASPSATPSTICIGDFSQLDVLGSGGAAVFTYAWTSTPSGFTSNIQNPVVSPTTTTTYTAWVNDGFNTVSANVVVTVNPLPVIVFSPMAEVCLNASPITLSAGSPSGGIYSGTGVSAGLFNPSVAGVGTHTITYTYTNTNNCTNSATQTITVLPLPTVLFAPIPNICVGTPAVQLTQGFPAGGTYTGPAVNPATGIFHHASLGAGTYTLTYTYADPYTGCTNSATQTATVTPIPAVTFTPPASVCVNAAVFALSGGLPAGGTYSGTGVSNNMFNPATAGVGTHLITYTYIDPATGCVNSKTANIQVQPLPSPSISGLAASYCVNAGAVSLLGTPVSGGVFSGPGISGTIFYPSVAGPGTHVITYTSTSIYGCVNSTSQTVTVNALPVVTFASISALCVSASPLTLTGGAPAGGTYSGTGVTGNTFNPATAGVGLHILTYSYTSLAGCSSSATQSIVVNPLPVVTFSTIPAVCIGSSPVILNQGFPSGGAYSGPGVNTSNQTFNPSTTGVGTFTLTYTYSDANSCTKSATQTITVNPLPVVSFSTPGHVCLNGGTVALSTGSPAGGVFSGPGVSGFTFNPLVTGVGTFLITYTYTNPATGCSNSATNNIYVEPIPTVSIVGLASSFCQSQGPVALNGSPVSGGVFSGIGVSNNVFYPSLAGPGSHTITYTYASSYGCINSTSQTVTVNATPTVSFAGPLSACINTTSVALSGGSPSGGVYSGTGVVNNVFYPATAGIGVHTIIYTYTNVNNCSNTATQIMVVNPQPQVSVGAIPSLCVNASAYTLTQGSPAGGTYSGSGVNSSTGVFTPSWVGAGTYTIGYSYTDPNTGCSNSANGSVTVNALPTVTLATFADACINSPAFALGGGIPAGGIYSGAGVSNNMFNASVAGTGSHTITYTYTNPATGCTNVASKNIFVNALPTITFSNLPNQCPNSAPLSLISYATPLNGTFSGTGVTGNTFNGSLTGPGTFTITYTKTDGSTGCTNSATKNIVVNTLPVVSFGSVGSACINETTMLLNTGTPAGGTYSGPGVTGTNFDASVAGLGAHNLTYSYTSPSTGCTNTAIVSVFVYGLPNPTFQGLLTSYCEDGAGATLTGIPGGGTFSGPGISGNTFSPGAAHAGTHTIGYTYTNSVGCSGTTYKTVVVYADPYVFIGNDTTICINHTLVLNAGAGMSSYLWSNGMTTQSVSLTNANFSLGVNTFHVTVMQNGCDAKDTILVTVDPCTGFENLAGDDAIHVFPNPNDGQFNVVISGPEGDMNLSIYDAIGKVIASERFTITGSGLYHQAFDLKSLPPGVYFIKVIGNEFTRVKKVIIN